MPFMVPTWHYSQSIGYGKYCPENIKHLHPHHRVSRGSLLWLEHDFEA
jgi:hypothetical protein